MNRKATPRFSVILCTFNRRNLVLSTLASLRRQTLPYPQFEVIVIDNGSSDETLSAIRAYVSAGAHNRKRTGDIWHVQCLSEPQNGLAYARNTGLQAAAGEIAVFLDDDTLAAPHFLERLSTAYEETGADAIGGPVELRWEGPRPHWLTEDLLETLGYFAPGKVRTRLEEPAHFSNSNFSVTIDALREIGRFSPLLSKRFEVPVSMEAQDLCRRLHRAGYTIWYEPAAIVTHRVPAARLTRPFFVGRAYWQGRSEVLAQYVASQPEQQDHSSTGVPGGTLTTPVKSLAHDEFIAELRNLAYLALIHRPLLKLAGKSTNERLVAAMEQARIWGRLQQQLVSPRPIEGTLLAGVRVEDEQGQAGQAQERPQGLPPLQDHAALSARSRTAVLLVRPVGPDPAAELLAHELSAQGADCTAAMEHIPLAWLWQQRARRGQAGGIVHFFRAGAFNLSAWQHLWLRCGLWLARRLGVRIISSDNGGWWQQVGSLRTLPRRLLEHKLFHSSAIVLSSTHLPASKDKGMRVHYLPQPGFHGYFAPVISPARARKQLGLPVEARTIYLCFAHEHTEEEVLLLIEAFQELKKGRGRGQMNRAPGRGSRSIAPGDARASQLLLVGLPPDKQAHRWLLKLAALNPAIHLTATVPCQEDMPLYMGAIDVVVLPHTAAIEEAGLLETAYLGLSFERVVVAPNLPRFRGMLPPRASILYDPTSRDSLVLALSRARKRQYHLNEQELAALDARSSWEQYTRRLLKIYQKL